MTALRVPGLQRLQGLRPGLGLLLGWLWLVFPSVSWALPRYAVEYGQNCILCHVSPTGGGMRSLYATQYLIPEEIAARSWDSSGAEGLMDDFSPELTSNISVGMDARTLIYQAEQGQGSVISMQGDLYLHLQLSPRASAYFERGQNGGGEGWGLVSGLPGDGYLRAGRFIPDFGWRFADHRMFNRRFVASPGGENGTAFLLSSGWEMGFSPGPLFVSMSLLDGGTSLGDSYAARVMVRREMGSVRVAVGGSVLRKMSGGGHWRTSGGFWALSLGRVTWLGEYDETRQLGQLGNLAAHQLTVRLQRGLEARLTYGFQDPQRAVLSGTRSQYGVGLAYMPTPYLAIQLMGNRRETVPDAAVADNRDHQVDMVVHFFY